MARLLEKYHSEVKSCIKEKFKYKNIMQAPKLVKIVLNMGIGEALQDKSILDDAEKNLAIISGQKPVKCKAKKSVAGFKVREGYTIGCKVTLRGKRMYEFLDRLINIALPAVKDFRGISRKMDGKGNYSLGWKDYSLFPEINIDNVKNQFGFDINFVTTAETDEEGFALLQELGLPFKRS